MSSFTAGFLLFPDLTQLDLTGPYEVIARLPGCRAELIAKSAAPVRSDTGLSIMPTVTFAHTPALDLICIPGGPGTIHAASDPQILAFVRASAEKARFVMSVCTGSLILGAAGLLQGREAACHWAFREQLWASGATPVSKRIVSDGKYHTGGGVTSGIDLALSLAAIIAGQDAAEMIQLVLEYDPRPPFAAGSPEQARPELVDRVRKQAAGLFVRNRTELA